MKKILFGTTALLAAGAFSTSAQASDPIKLQLGGFMNYWVAAADQDDDATVEATAQNFDVIGNAEVHFSGETTLDNGMKIFVQTELEAGTRDGDDDIDESWMAISGKYGKVLLGSTDDVAVKSAVLAPSVSPLGAAGDGSDLENYLLIPSTVDYIEIAQSQTGDANKISYFTPRMYGLQAGVSFTPSNDTNGDDSTNNSVAKAASEFDNAWTAALTYEADYSGVGIAASATYAIVDDRTVAVDDNQVENYAGGLNVSYEGFTVGGAVMVQSADTATNYSAGEGLAWQIGASYATGPYAVSATYYSSAVEGGSADGQDDEVQQFQLAGTYALGAGVDLFAEVDYLNAEDEGGNATNGNEGAIGGAVGLALSF